MGMGGPNLFEEEECCASVLCCYEIWVEDTNDGVNMYLAILKVLSLAEGALYSEL